MYSPSVTYVMGSIIKGTKFESDEITWKLSTGKKNNNKKSVSVFH